MAIKNHINTISGMIHCECPQTECESVIQLIMPKIKNRGAGIRVNS